MPFTYDAQPVPAITPRAVDLAQLPSSDREAAWRTLAAGQFEVSGLPDAFVGSGRLYALGPVTLTDSVHPQQTFARTSDRARRDGADGFLCSVELSCGFTAAAGEQEMAVGVRKVTLWDMARPSVKVAQAGRTLCLSIERDVLRAVVPDMDGLHGLTLGDMGDLFVDHLLAVERALPRMRQDTAAAVGRASLELLAACVRSSGERETTRPAVKELVLGLAESYIRDNIHRPDLTPEQIAAALKISRTRMYDIFEPVGGVSLHIRELRLDEARSVLLRSGPDARVGEIAFALGFKSESQFNRAFSTRFGKPPGRFRRGTA